MTSSVVQNASGGIVTELWKASEPEPHRLSVAALLALGVHLGFVLWAPAYEAVRAPAPPPVEVEIALREPPPPPPPPAPAAEPAAPPPAAPPVARPVVAKAAPPPPAAAAPAVMTAAPAAPEAQTAEPFDFTSDPRSTSFSSGVVAVGGTARHGLAGAQLGGNAAEPRPAAARGDGLTAASDLSQSPRLRRADPCHGFFPKSARDDIASAVVRVVVDTEGVATQVNVVSETPPGQGFGAAARTCMLEQSFVPALNREGRAAATAVNVNVRFRR